MSTFHFTAVRRLCPNRSRPGGVRCSFIHNVSLKRSVKHGRIFRSCLSNSLYISSAPLRCCASSLADRPPEPSEGIEISLSSVGVMKQKTSAFWSWNKSQSDEHSTVSEALDQHSYGSFLARTRRRSMTLTQAVNFVGLDTREGRVSPKTDFSAIHPRMWPSSKTRPSQVRVQAIRAEMAGKSSLRATLDAYVDLLHPLGKVLDDPDTLTEEAKRGLTSVFTPNRLRLLSLNGYKVEDVVSWAWVTTATDSTTITQRMEALATRHRSEGCGTVNSSTSLRGFGSSASGLGSEGRNILPTFIILRILLREYLSATSIHHLLQDARMRIPAYSDKLTFKNASWLVWQQDVAMLLTIRLLRHARRNAPERLIDIAALSCELLHNGKGGKALLNPTVAKRLSFSYNRILSLLAIPSSAHPYRAVQIQQQAQFRILRGMLEYKPNLPVSREGYRAMISVQIAHRKTEEERQWAEVKSPNWPPWREHKLGIDADTEYPGSQSRASIFLSRMTEAGYSHSGWDQAAQILAGWDTDKSPTIQTRSLIRRGSSYWSTPSQLVQNGDNRGQTTPEQETWAARVKATRTVREAWACFCSFKSEASIENAYHVYHAMFQKLLAPIDNTDVPVLPGDGRERYPDPNSSQTFLYVPIEPPSVDVLYGRMLEEDIRPAGRLLSDLLDGSMSLETGLQYIRDSRLSEVKKDVLLSAEKYPQNFIRDTLGYLPNYTFAAFLRLLLRSPRPDTIKFWLPTSASAHTRYSERTQVTPASYAFQMLRISETRYLPAWRAFFDQLCHRVKAGSLPGAHAKEVGRSWLILRRLHVFMRNNAVSPDHSILSAILQVLHETLLCLDPKLTAKALSTAKSMFAETSVVQQASSPAWLDCSPESNLISTPDPGVLWSMVRICGIAQDIQGIVGLVRWMKYHEPALAAVRYELRNGAEMTQTTSILIRIFLEGSWASQDQLQNGVAAIASKGQLRLVKALMENQATGLSWPDDYEVKEYLASRSRWISRVRRAVHERMDNGKKVDESPETDPTRDGAENEGPSPGQV